MLSSSESPAKFEAARWDAEDRKQEAIERIEAMQGIMEEQHLEDLQPVRVGEMAYQPLPELSALIFVGLDFLLPVSLRLLCSCAGLFFARVHHQTEENSYVLYVAALPHYFDADLVTHNRHVRRVTLSQIQFDTLLVEYTRSRRSLPTWELLEELQEHAGQAPYVSTSSPTIDEEVCAIAPGEKMTHTSPTSHGEPDELEEGPEVIIPIHVLQQLWSEMEEQFRSKMLRRYPPERLTDDLVLRAALKPKFINNMLLRAALNVLSSPKDQALVARALSWKRNAPLAEGLAPIYGTGKRKSEIKALKLLIVSPKRWAMPSQSIGARTA